MPCEKCEAALDLVEAVMALERELVANDQQRPPVADEIERPGDRTLYVRELFPLHDKTLR